MKWFKKKKDNVIEIEEQNDFERINNSQIPKVKFEEYSSCENFFVEYFKISYSSIKRCYYFNVTNNLFEPTNLKPIEDEVLKMKMPNMIFAVRYAVGYMLYNMGFDENDDITIQKWHTITSSDDEETYACEILINGIYENYTFTMYKKQGLYGYIGDIKTGRKLKREHQEGVDTYEIEKDLVNYSLVEKKDINGFGFKKEETKTEIGYTFTTEENKEKVSFKLLMLPSIDHNLENIIDKEKVFNVLKLYSRGEITIEEYLEYIIDEIYIRVKKYEHLCKEEMIKVFYKINLELKDISIFFMENVVVVNGRVMSFKENELTSGLVKYLKR